MRVLFASTRGAGHFNPLVPFIEACRRQGHDVLVAGPPAQAPAVEAAGYPFRMGGEPPEDELSAVWTQVPTVPPYEQNRLVIGEIFAPPDPAVLRAAVELVLDDERYAAAAQRIADEMRRLPPVDDALVA